MKFSKIFLVGFTSPAVTDDAVISTLTNLENISLKIFNSESIKKHPKWKNRWTQKFMRNTQRMRESFGRCGTLDGEENDEIEIKYDVSKPCGAIDELINGYSNWADLYIGACKGQMKKAHQKNRFERWNKMLDKGIRFEKNLTLKNQDYHHK